MGVAEDGAGGATGEGYLNERTGYKENSAGSESQE